MGAQCGSVVICRSSPSQKAAVVRMMSEYEMRQVGFDDAHLACQQGVRRSQQQLIPSWPATIHPGCMPGLAATSEATQAPEEDDMLVKRDMPV